jgi:hypothetical protein
MRISWFRMYHDARNDAKLRLLSDREFRIWFNLLCMASDQETDQRGSIPIDDDELLAVEVAEGDTKALQGVTARLLKLRIIEIEDNTIVFLNWPGRQYDKPSDQPEAVRERVARWRERKKAANVTSNADVTPSNAPSNANRIGYDSNRIEEDRIEEPAPIPLGRKKAIPKDFTITPDLKHWAIVEGYNTLLDLEKETKEFIEYWTIGEGSGEKRKNWDLVWKTRIRTRAEDVAAKQRRYGGKSNGANNGPQLHGAIQPGGASEQSDEERTAPYLKDIPPGFHIVRP